MITFFKLRRACGRYLASRAPLPDRLTLPIRDRHCRLSWYCFRIAMRCSSLNRLFLIYVSFRRRSNSNRGHSKGQHQDYYFRSTRSKRCFDAFKEVDVIEKGPSRARHGDLGLRRALMNGKSMEGKPNEGATPLSAIAIICSSGRPQILHETLMSIQRLEPSISSRPSKRCCRV